MDPPSTQSRFALRSEYSVDESSDGEGCGDDISSDECALISEAPNSTDPVENLVDNLAENEQRNETPLDITALEPVPVSVELQESFLQNLSDNLSGRFTELSFSMALHKAIVFHIC